MDPNYEKNCREQDRSDTQEMSLMLKPNLLQQDWALDPIGEAMRLTHTACPVTDRRTSSVRINVAVTTDYNRQA